MQKVNLCTPAENFSLSRSSSLSLSPKVEKKKHKVVNLFPFAIGPEVLECQSAVNLNMLPLWPAPPLPILRSLFILYNAQGAREKHIHTHTHVEMLKKHIF